MVETDKFNLYSAAGSIPGSSDDEAGDSPPTVKTTTVKTPPPDDYEPGESQIIDARKPFYASN